MTSYLLKNPIQIQSVTIFRMKSSDHFILSLNHKFVLKMHLFFRAVNCIVVFLMPEIKHPVCRTMAQTVSRSLIFTTVGQIDISESDRRDEPNRGCVLKVFITPLRRVFEGVFDHAQNSNC